MNKCKLLIALILAVLMVTTLAFASCDPNEQTPPEDHTCQSVCPTCGKCTNSTCGEDACSDKCQGHNPVVTPHVCKHVCAVCGKCLDATCLDPVCADKCQGHTEPSVHVCQHVCPTCGKCSDLTCRDAVCADKCTGHKAPEPPEISDKTDFIKLPGEAVHNESFANLVVGGGTVTYSYALNAEDSSKGKLTDNGDGTFDFIPNGVFVGSVRIEFTAQRDGLSASKTVILVYKAVNPVIFDADGETVFDLKDYSDDVKMTVHTYGTESDKLYYDVLDVSLNGQSIGQDNYFVTKGDGNVTYCDVKASYLAALSPAKYTFTLTTAAGSAEFIVEVKDTRKVTVDVAEFDFVKDVTESDLIVNVTPYNNVVSADSFAIDGVTMNATQHFTYEDNVLTVFNAFMQSLDKGVYVITVNGEDAVTINVKTADSPMVDDDSKVNVLQKSNLSDLTVNVSLFGKQSETLIKLADSELDSDSYEITETAVILKQDYLATLDYGQYTFNVVNVNGQATFTVKLGDKPAASSADQNVTKFTYEVISDEALRVQAQGDWQISGLTLVSVTYYDYAEQVVGDGVSADVNGLTASGSFGSLTLNADNLTFGFARANGWFGIVTFAYTVTDELDLTSDQITMDVVYKQIAPVIDGQNDKVYNRVGGQDIVFTITNAEGNSDFAVNKITCGSAQLTLNEDYTIEEEKNGSYRYFTIKSAYLASIEQNSVTLTLYTDGGRSDFTITIVEPLTCIQATADFDKNSETDVTFVLAGSPLTVRSIKLNGEVVSSERYSFDNGNLTVLNSYLQGLNYGEHVFTVSNGCGETELKVVISDSRQPVLNNGEIEFTRGGVNAKAVVELYGNTFTELRLDGAAVSADNYTFTDGVLTISGEYLDGIEGQSAEFTVVTSVNELTIIINFTEVFYDPEITAPAAGYQIDKYFDLRFTVDMRGNTFKGVKYGEADLADIADYEYDLNSGTLTIKAGFINGIYRFGTSSYTLTLTTEEDRNADFDVIADNADNRILNGGFESGNLYGWNSYAIWKGEEGMIAWTNDRVVNGNYYDDNVYNKDGNYNLGIYGGNISKDSGQERMGHLRSSNFTLGGSGWISFKLGGGKNPSFAYVSVRLTGTNEEIARFANSHFNDKETLALNNAEAYMFQYYYDLSDYLNKQMYITVTDAASNEWCVLSADSFFTYYETAPETTDYTLAVNILPTVLNADSADNSVKNGNFADGLNDWSNVNGVFKLDGDVARSDEGGDGATGVLRSSAFIVSDKQYIRFDWAGGLSYDKQIFVSVKEVGTNIEVLRYVRRDNLSSKQNGDFDNHMLDLSSLDSNKQYYLEFADNTASGWGLSMIKNVRFVDETEWNSVTDGDRAVSISGLNTAFQYVLPYEA